MDNPDIQDRVIHDKISADAADAASLNREGRRPGIMSAEWYAIHSKPNMEATVTGQLAWRGFECFCPLLKVRPVNPRCRKSTCDRSVRAEPLSGAVRALELGILTRRRAQDVFHEGGAFPLKDPGTDRRGCEGKHKAVGGPA
jgi:hypothetical protein